MKIKSLADNRLYGLVCQAIDGMRGDLVRISRILHRHPEVAFKEKRACRLLSEFLANNDFELTGNAGGLDTAFIAQAGRGKKPAVAYMAEYDALPGIGHGCGHNLIAAASIGAGVALAGVLKELQGKVCVIGTPAEEGGGGKIILCREKVFDGIDAAMMMHPGCKTELSQHTMSMAPLDIAFHGCSAHAAALPYAGKNALDGIILTFNNINALRQQMKPEARVHGIITHGGEAPNIIPDYAAGRFFVRTMDLKYLNQLLEKVSNCAAGAAKATGTRVVITPGKEVYHPFHINQPLVEAFAQNLHRRKIRVHSHGGKREIGSTDVGNVSRIVPAIHPTIAITSRNISLHSEDFARAAATDEAQEKMIEAAKALAMTGVDFLCDEALRRDVAKAFTTRSTQCGMA